MSRPLQYDELCTIEYYTWAGLDPSGEPRRLRRAADLAALPAPTPFQLGMGIYRSLGVWREPNNHVLNSVLVNLSLAGERTAVAARLPAFVGALVFAGLLYTVGGPLLGWARAAPVVAVWAFVSPYVVNFGQMARGYTWMLVLQLAWIGAAYAVARRPRSLARGAACATFAVLSLMNVASVGLDWVVPAYIAFWFFPPAEAQDREALRTNLALQALGIGAVASVFVMDRLPYLFSALRLYGDPFGAQGFTSLVRATLEYLFPPLTWALVAALGAAGCGILLCSPGRFLGVLAVFVVLVTVLQAELTERLPYARTMGYLLPIVLLGATYLLELVLRRARGRVAAGLAWGIIGILSVLLVRVSLDQRAEAEPRVPILEQLVAAGSAPPGAVDYAVMPHTSDYHLDKFLPPDWLDDQDGLPSAADVRLHVLLERRAGWGIEMQRARGHEAVWQSVDCERFGCTPAVGGYRLATLAGTSSAFRADLGGSGWTFVVWYPAREGLGLDSHALFDFLDGLGIPYLRRNVREPVKLDYVGRLHGLEFLASSEDQWLRIASALSGAMARFGGTAGVIRPAE